MKSKADAFVTLETELLSPEEDGVSFESSSLIRELKKSVFRGDDEITLILAKAFCEKQIKSQLPGEACVIYCRVSTEQQAVQGGLWRQLKTCADYARQHDYSIGAVFSEVASGIDPLPIREMVERIAAKRKCLILCEDHSRWSRKGAEDVPPATVIMASECSNRFDEALVEMIGKHREAIIASVQ